MRNGRPPTLGIVPPDAPAAVADDWEEATQPDPEQAVTNAMLYRLIKGTNAKMDGLARGLKWLAISVATMAGAFILFGALLLWMRK